MKKFALLLAVLLIVSVMAGCASDDKISDLENKVSKLERRINDLEDWKTQTEMAQAEAEAEAEAAKVNLLAIYATAPAGGYASLSNDASCLTIDTNPDDKEDFYSSEAVDYIQTVNQELGLPDAVFERMQSTRALDGTQTADYDNVFVTWSYHPDKGLRVIYEAK